MTTDELKEISKKNFQQLLDTYNENDKIMLPFLGSGISTPTGISTWYYLLVDLAKESQCPLNEKEVKELIDKNGYAKTASILKEKINDKEKYQLFLTQQFEPKNTLTTSTIIKIMIKFYSAVTTNYDTTIEEAIKTINFLNTHNNIETIDINIQDLPTLDSVHLLDKKNIIYLHGYKRNKNFLLTQEDYEYFYPSNYKKEGSEDLEDFLKAIIKGMNLVFMGFSFEDEDFCKFFKETTEKIILNNKKNMDQGYDSKGIEFNHFAFVKLKYKENEKLYNKLNNMKIKPIYYEENHSKLEDYLQKITKTEIRKEGDVINADKLL